MIAGVDRLCFGTSTFVAGRLRPKKDSEPGMMALRAAIGSGVRLIHTNPNLGTQWAVQQVLDSVDTADEMRHLIKVEAPLDASEATLRSCVEWSITTSCRRLGIAQVHALVIEVDLKRTRDRAMLVNDAAVSTFYAHMARIARASGRVDSAVAYCHSPAHMAVVLDSGEVDVVAAQYNLHEPWPALYLDRIKRQAMTFVGMSPLGRGSLVHSGLRNVPLGGRPLAAVRWAAADPGVDTVVITMSSVLHLGQVINAMRDRLPQASVEAVLGRWLGGLVACHPEELPTDPAIN